MPIDFPSNPEVNDTYTFAGYSWKWDGYGWQALNSSVVTIEGPQGPSGIVTAQDPLAYNQLTKTISLKIKAGGGILGSTAGLLIDTSIVPVVSGSNTFTASNTFTSTVSVTGSLTASNFSTTTFQLDDISDQFNGRKNNFVLRYRGGRVSLKNAFRLLINLNGIIQGVRFPEYVFMSPVVLNKGIWTDGFGNLLFDTNPRRGSTFFGTVLAGDTAGENYNYPFRALDIILGED
jgi:hypothetical protein